MATGRTISASFLTKRDAQVIELCDRISKGIANRIVDGNQRRKFISDFGKTSKTRDAGLGVGAGKLQRDALCTRGKQGKAPFSNRNLRWHPLVVADAASDCATPIEEIKIEGDELLMFVVEENGKRRRYRADKAHEMQERYVALPEHWIPHVNLLKGWSDTQWTQKSCVIPTQEACDWQDAVETFAILGIAVAVELFGADIEKVYADVTQILTQQRIDASIKLPSSLFPTQRADITNCPVCKVSIAENAAKMPERQREKVWVPPWWKTKNEEDERACVMYTHPLVERELRHSASNARYGHWQCYANATNQ